VTVRVEVPASALRRGDVLTIGGRPFTIRDRARMPGGELRLRLGGGAALTVPGATRLTALRAVPAPGPYEPPTRAQVFGLAAAGCALLGALGAAVAR
jgi:hypothetical protein